MKLKKIALGAAALALVACGEAQKPIAKSAAITPDSADDQKFAYMLGAQFGLQNFSNLPWQTGEGIDEDATVQGFRDALANLNDTTAKLQLPQDTLAAVSRRIQGNMRERYFKTQPDSTAKDLSDEQRRALIDSLRKALPINAAPAVKNEKVTLQANASEQQKFSYLVGVQFGNQFYSIGRQFQTDFDGEYFVLGIRDAGKKLRDTTSALTLPEDSLKAVGDRFNEKLKTIREEMTKKQQAEEEKLKAEVASLRGDTLANGMPAKMNFKVKASGITVKSEDLSDFAGKPLLMFYFSATCGHCAHAAPQILEIAKEFAQKGLTTVSIASGGNNKPGIRRFIDDAKFDETISVVWDESRQFGELYSDGYVPKVYLVNPNGTYKQYAAFEKEKEDLKKEIAELLNGKNVEWKIEVKKPAADSVKAPEAKQEAKKDAKSAKAKK
ncbi:MULTISPECIES: FKBP-type peptidyl-prolyl cis-trans isomerase N-terminal domain-containing protein [Fibrobacter]|jgi:thiol-disulfide isomerase/thioredoxin|uniref:Thiol-disulfide isomerase or thioredoxin n=1 Tax=Fibrobacter succinogenes TaxID=833 RepID=A0A380RVK7_FIBSU|nr:FKBP-type peptidyl-prolyl cis-trans isomerase N-terminal domain-containing protein [Fibrobacter succinogenes]PWJ37083.1 thiol-disulfide isomerase/thioredoxin [Fibrobacter succinogenes subsp. elongatus]SUQ19331.1 Thiol-disulfide isomerase or thioredoxin [Fibrobacter succinogenes]